MQGFAEKTTSNLCLMHTYFEKNLLRLEELAQNTLSQRGGTRLHHRIRDLTAIGGNCLSLAHSEFRAPYEERPQPEQVFDAPYPRIPKPDRVFVEHRIMTTSQLRQLTPDFGQHTMVWVIIDNRRDENLFWAHLFEDIEQTIAQ